MEITKQQFQAYERVRASGITNMWDTQAVELYSGLDRDTILEIIKHYSKLNQKYLDVRE